MIKQLVAPVSAHTHLDWKDFADDRLSLTLEKLQKLNVYAAQIQVEPNQLAVTISDFRRWGHSDTELRLLVIEGIVRHLKETTSGSLGERQFEEGGRYSIGETSCFILAKNSQLLLKPRSTLSRADEQTLPATDLPLWDLKLRRLMYKGKLVKHFKCPARNQETILSAFQEEGWPLRISDPIPPSKESESKQRLHDAIRSLNRNQTNSVIKFGGDGTGEGVLWCIGNAHHKLPSNRR